MGDLLEALVKKEDWWAVWLGFAIVILAFFNVIPFPSFGSWTTVPQLSLSMFQLTIVLFVILSILMSIAFASMGTKPKAFIGFTTLYIFAFFSLLISKQVTISQWGLEYVIWALLIGLILGNLLPLPEWLKGAMKSELLIKTGLVLLGAEILLNTLMAAGLAGIFEVTIGLSIVWYFCYYLARKLGMSKSFASIMATATSVCGVSAAIAAGGAVKGDPKEVSYTIGLVLLFAMPMVLLMPYLGRIMGLSGPVVGAWIGGTIDTTPAVVAAGALYDERAMQFASIVKMSQNIMIGLVAFLLAAYWSTRVEKQSGAPKKIEIWYRFPKFILGFVAASVLFTLLPFIGVNINPIVSITKNVRGWLFSMAFVSIGANTDFRGLLKIGGGRPLLVFLAASLIDIALSLISAIAFFGGRA